MAGVGIEIELQGFEALQAKLAALGNVDFTPLLEGVGALMERQTLDRFQAERGPDGQPWRPLKAETVLRKLGGSRRAYGKRGRMTKTRAGQAGRDQDFAAIVLAGRID